MSANPDTRPGMRWVACRSINRQPPSWPCRAMAADGRWCCCPVVVPVCVRTSTAGVSRMTYPCGNPHRAGLTGRSACKAVGTPIESCLAPAGGSPCEPTTTAVQPLPLNAGRDGVILASLPGVPTALPGGHPVDGAAPAKLRGVRQRAELGPHAFSPRSSTWEQPHYAPVVPPGVS
jgi:hypothetical protein